MVQPELTPVEIVGCEIDETGSPLALDNADCAKSSEHEPLHRLTAVGNRPRRLGAVANGWEPSPTAAKADVTEGLYCGIFRFGTLSIESFLILFM